MNQPRPIRGPRRAPSDVPGRLKGEGTATGAGGGGFTASGPGQGGLRPTPPGPAKSVGIPVPWLVRPPNAREINVNASATGYTAATTPLAIAGSQFTVPPDNVGVLRSVVFNINTLLITSAITYTIRFNGNPVEGWVQVPIFPTAVGYMGVAFGPDETFIFIPEQTTIDVSINVTDAGTYQAGVAYHGWSYPKRVADHFATLYNF